MQRLAYRGRCVPRSPKEIDRVLLLAGTLRRIGWTRSVGDGRPVTADGQPLPWLTYPAIHWLDSALRGDEAVFEFGSGGSTAWLAARVQAITSVEHDPQWFAQVRDSVPAKAKIELTARSDYAASIDGRGPFDIVVIDGLDRPSCARHAVSELSDDGAILIDNSDRSELAETLRELDQMGFSRIDFAGFAPGLTNFSCTSVLSRDLARWSAQKLPTAWGSSHALAGEIEPLQSGAWRISTDGTD